MTRGVQFLRLLTAFAISLLACCFVVMYNHASRTRFIFEHPDADSGQVPYITFVTLHGAYTFLVPAVGLLIGIVIIWRWPKSHVWFELILSTMWILALVWVGMCLLAWQCVSVPLFHGMQFHYRY